MLFFRIFQKNRVLPLAKKNLSAFSYVTGPNQYNLAKKTSKKIVECLGVTLSY